MPVPLNAGRRTGATKESCGLAERSLLGIAGSLFAIVGAGLATASTFVGGDSTFFVMIGFGLMIAGVLLARGVKAGGWAYGLVVVTTMAWSLQNAGTGSSIAYRFAGPVILFGMIALLVPILPRCSCSASAGPQGEVAHPHAAKGER